MSASQKSGVEIFFSIFPASKKFACRTVTAARELKDFEYPSPEQRSPLRLAEFQNLRAHALRLAKVIEAVFEPF